MGRPGFRPEREPHLRLSDEERDGAVARLSEHYAAGRLDKDEFDERSDAVWTARTGADLVPVFADLEPARDPRGVRAGGYGGPWRRRGWLPLPIVPVLFVLIALTALTHVPFVLLALAGWFLLVRRRRGWGRPLR